MTAILRNGLFLAVVFVCSNVSNALTGHLTPNAFLQDQSASLSDLLSSPERYAKALNMTIDEVSSAKNRHAELSEDLHLRLQSKELSGKEKHTLICQHRFQHGRHPFVCPNCWSYLPVCVCGLAGERKQALPKGMEIVVWTHHREWGLTSNTGCMLALTLKNCRLFMKGLPEHDKQLEQLLRDKTCLPVVLWPDQSENQDARDRSYEPELISLKEVRSEIEKRKVVLIAVDGTWRNARRMVARLPSTVPRLDLPVDAVFSQKDLQEKSESILAPLRSKGPSIRKGYERQVCTAEAVVGALLNFGMDSCVGAQVLELTQKKVDLIKRYRGKVSQP